MSLPERFTSKFTVDESTGCWVWTSKRSNKDYGLYCFQGKYCSAHRFAYECLVGPIPEGLQIDHLCRNRPCCNPEHLEPVTAKENMRRWGAGERMSARTHCPQGHPYDETNTRLYRNRRVCRECERKRLAEFVASRKKGDR